MNKDAVIDIIRDICNADFIHPLDKVEIIKKILGEKK